MRRPLTERQIAAFRAVMLSGTTTTAAAMLHTTQPSISRLLGQIGDASGLRLFDLHAGRLRPTQEAWALLKHVERHFHGLEAIQREVASLRTHGARALQIGCTPAIGWGVMPDVVDAFLRRWPGVRVELQTLGERPLLEGLLHGAHDLILTPGLVAAANLETRILHRERVICAIPDGHRLAGRRRLHVRDLRGQTLLTLPGSDPIAQSLQTHLRRHGVEPGNVIETNYSISILRMASRGTGIGIVNPYAAAGFEDRLVCRPLEPSIEVPVVMALAPQVAPSTMTLSLIDELQRYLAGRVPAARAGGRQRGSRLPSNPF